MEITRKLDLMNDKKISGRVTVAVSGFFLAGLAALMVFHKFVRPFDLEAFSVLRAVVVFVAVSALHELVHGVLYKAFNPAGKVKYGIKGMMLYATSPGSLYPKGKFYIISLAPAVVVNLILLALLLTGVITGLEFGCVFILHLSGCFGDFLISSIIFKDKTGDTVEDTDVGITIYRTAA